MWERYEAGAWLVVPTNTNLNSSGEAVMGAGVAGAVAKRFPGLPARYGEVLASGRERMVDSEHRLLLAPTKRDWKAPSVPEMVDELLEAVAVWARKHPGESVVLPAPGCGLGGLDFAEVSARCRAALAGLAVTLVAPDGTVVEMVSEPLVPGRGRLRPDSEAPAHSGPPAAIEGFDGPWRFLSNYHTAPLRVAGTIFASGEHAFNAAKTLVPDEAERVRAAPTPGEAKRIGRQVALRPDWDATARFEAMRQVVDAKFADEPLRSKLADTGDALLVESNTWHDQTWGDCTCPKHRGTPGANHLGRMLMAKRAALRSDQSERWPRVAVTGHRSLEPSEAAFAQAELARLAGKLRDRHGTTTAISGMALGADTWWAEAAVDAGLVLWAYIPFEAQADRWPEADRERWAGLRSRATREVVLGVDYDVALLHARNSLMVRDAELVVAVVDPARAKSGTASTMAKAGRAGKPLVVVDVTAKRTRIVWPATEPQ